MMRGKVSYFKWADGPNEPYNFFGFVQPSGTIDKTQAYRFTDAACVGMSPALGEEVEVTLYPPKEGQRRQCASIRRVR